MVGALFALSGTSRWASAVEAQNNKEFVMPAPRRSKRFDPNKLTEKIVPALLVILVVILLAVFIIIGLSLMGIIPSA